MPTELTIIAVTALLAGLLLMGIMLAGRGTETSEPLAAHASPVLRRRDEVGDVRGRPTRRCAWCGG